MPWRRPSPDLDCPGAVYNRPVRRNSLLWLFLSTWVSVACAVTPTPPPAPTATVTLRPAAPPAAATPSQAAPTPVIIASPTPTPTPFLHIVRKGETLIGIAVTYNVSLQALQAANGDLDPRALQIGQTLIIPLSEDSVAAQAEGLPSPMPLELGQPACLPQASGALSCIVLARNPGPGAVENVSARIILADAQGLPITSTVGSTGLDIVPPGVAATIAVWFAPGVQSVAAQGADLLSAYPSNEPSQRYVPLQLDSYTAAQSGRVWEIKGVIKNPTADAVSLVRVVAILLAANERPVGYQRLELPGGLEPGASRDFDLPVTALADDAIQYVLWVEGKR